MPIQKIQPTTDKQPTPEELHNFYECYYSGEVKIRFDKLKTVNLLRSLGFARYDIPDSERSEIVYIQNGVIQIADLKKIRDEMENYILRLPNMDKQFQRKVTLPDGMTEMQPFTYTITPNFILGKLYDNLTKLFTPDLLERLRPTAPIEILQDEAKRKYFFFQNTAVEVTDNGIQTVPYERMDSCIWRTSIHNRHFEYTATKGEFETFFNHICNEDEERKQAAMTLVGYLMHDYYEYNRAAVLLTDVNNEHTGIAAGRTGKGIIGKALGQMLNRNDKDTIYVAISGKNFDHSPEKRGTCYSQADMSTSLIYLEDVLKNFDIEQLFNDITDGCEMRKLHQDAFKKDVKFLISMNKTMYNIDSPSVKARLYIFELANFYSETNSPEDEFGHRFFGGAWQQKDWNEFYSFMLRCQLLFFQKGVIKPKDVNYIVRSLKESLPDDFYYWFDSLVSGYVQNKQRVQLRKVADLFQPYREKYPMPDEEKTRRKFTTWCKRYLDRMSIPYKEHRGTVDYLILYPTSND